MADTSTSNILSNHPKCPCDDCWCITCINNSNKIKAEIDSQAKIRKRKYIDNENDQKTKREMEIKKQRIKPIADGIRKKHRYVFRFKKTEISYGLDGYESAHIVSSYYGVFSSYENVEIFLGSLKKHDDVVVVKSDKLTDEEIVELDKGIDTSTSKDLPKDTSKDLFGC
jgi:hypothetical protein